jgi:hypothetical protein
MLEEFSTEMMIHCVGVQKADNSGILIFTTVLVCLDCGFSYFTTPESELAMLREALSQKTVMFEKSSRSTAA